MSIQSKLGTVTNLWPEVFSILRNYLTKAGLQALTAKSIRIIVSELAALGDRFMANAEFDVKSVTDAMEKDNNGCALLFNEAFQLMNKDFDRQMKMIGQVEKEAQSRPDNILTFEHVHEKAFDPKRNRELAFDGVNIRLPDGKPIFQEIKTSLTADNSTLNIQRTCKPGKGKI